MIVEMFRKSRMIGSSAFFSWAAQTHCRARSRLLSSDDVLAGGLGFFEIRMLGKIEPVALDIGRDRSGDEMIDRQTGFHAMTNFSGRYIDPAGPRQA